MKPNGAIHKSTKPRRAQDYYKRGKGDGYEIEKGNMGFLVLFLVGLIQIALFIVGHMGLTHDSKSPCCSSTTVNFKPHDLET